MDIVVEGKYMEFCEVCGFLHRRGQECDCKRERYTNYPILDMLGELSKWCVGCGRFHSLDAFEHRFHDTCKRFEDFAEHTGLVSKSALIKHFRNKSSKYRKSYHNKMFGNKRRRYASERWEKLKVGKFERTTAKSTYDLIDNVAHKSCPKCERMLPITDNFRVKYDTVQTYCNDCNDGYIINYRQTDHGKAVMSRAQLKSSMLQRNLDPKTVLPSTRDTPLWIHGEMYLWCTSCKSYHMIEAFDEQEGVERGYKTSCINSISIKAKFKKPGTRYLFDGELYKMCKECGEFKSISPDNFRAMGSYICQTCRGE